MDAGRQWRDGAGLTYQIALAPWLVVQPDAQFFFDPPFSRRDAQAIGAQVVAIF